MAAAISLCSGCYMTPLLSMDLYFLMALSVMVDLHYRLSKSLDAELPGLATSHHYCLGLSIYMYTHNENHAKFIT